MSLLHRAELLLGKRKTPEPQKKKDVARAAKGSGAGTDARRKLARKKNVTRKDEGGRDSCENAKRRSRTKKKRTAKSGRIVSTGDLCSTVAAPAAAVRTRTRAASPAAGIARADRGKPAPRARAAKERGTAHRIAPVLTRGTGDDQLLHRPLRARTVTLFDVWQRDEGKSAHGAFAVSGSDMADVNRQYVALFELVNDILFEGQGRGIILHGMPGSGKSAMLRHLGRAPDVETCWVSCADETLSLPGAMEEMAALVSRPTKKRMARVCVLDGFDSRPNWQISDKQKRAWSAARKRLVGARCKNVVPIIVSREMDSFLWSLEKTHQWRRVEVYPPSPRAVARIIVSRCGNAGAAAVSLGEARHIASSTHGDVRAALSLAALPPSARSSMLQSQAHAREREPSNIFDLGSTVVDSTAYVPHGAMEGYWDGDPRTVHMVVAACRVRGKSNFDTGEFFDAMADLLDAAGSQSTLLTHCEARHKFSCGDGRLFGLPYPTAEMSFFGKRRAISARLSSSAMAGDDAGPSDAHRRHDGKEAPAGGAFLHDLEREHISLLMSSVVVRMEALEIRCASEQGSGSETRNTRSRSRFAVVNEYSFGSQAAVRAVSRSRRPSRVQRSRSRG